MKTTSQKAKIREYLENNGKLTPMAALNFWGCDRLASRIYDIREDYANEWFNQRDDNTPLKEIKTEMVKTASGKRIAQYSCITD